MVAVALVVAASSRPGRELSLENSRDLELVCIVVLVEAEVVLLL